MAIETGKNSRRFPQGFKWGTAASAFQFEGNRDRKRDTDWDRFLTRKKILNGETGPDWWTEGKAEGDFETAAALNLNAQRIGLEWARIEPSPGQWDYSAIARYRQIIGLLNKLGLEPIVTLQHFTLPSWVADQGGWLNKKTVEDFAGYAHVAASEFGDVSTWITINEPNHIVTFGHVLGTWPPQMRSLASIPRLRHSLGAAHSRAAEEVKRVAPDSRVMAANHIQWLKPVNANSASDRIITRFSNWLLNWWAISATQGHSDAVGVNIYSGYEISFSPERNMSRDPKGNIQRLPMIKVADFEGPRTDMGWPVNPGMFLEALLAVHRLSPQKDIYVTENGLADKKDELRPAYLLSHAAAVLEAISRGVPVRGYYHWSLADNLEWVEGYGPRFGLIEVDHYTGARKVRPSAGLYREIASSESFDVNTLADHHLNEDQKQIALAAIAGFEDIK